MPQATDVEDGRLGLDLRILISTYVIRAGRCWVLWIAQLMICAFTLLDCGRTSCLIVPGDFYGFLSCLSGFGRSFLPASPKTAMSTQYAVSLSLSLSLPISLTHTHLCRPLPLLKQSSHSTAPSTHPPRSSLSARPPPPLTKSLPHLQSSRSAPASPTHPCRALSSAS
jgi:hypothetical protein